jgi:hypothetical protein
MGLFATSSAYGPPEKRDSSLDVSLLPELQTLMEDQRSLITIVPGEGNVLGVWVLGGKTYAIRNKVGGATSGFYVDSALGWTEVELGTALNFDGTTINGEPVPGTAGTPTTIKGGTSGAQGDLMGISYHGLWETGATGRMILSNVTGTFADDEDIEMPLIQFDTGSVEIVAGDSIKGATSSKEATVTSVTITSGTWSGGSAAGYISVKNNTGTWTAAEDISVGGVKRAQIVSSPAQPTEVKVAVANGTTYTQTLQPNGSYEFVNYNFLGNLDTNAMFGAGGVDNGFYYDGTTFVKIESGRDEDKPEHVIAHVKHLFYSYADGSIQHSSIGEPNKWSVVTGSAELGVGDVVSGFGIEINDVLSVFTRNDCYMLYGTSALDWKLRRFHAGSGAIQNTIQKMDQTFFLDDRGLTSIYTVQYFGDFQSAVTSDKIDPLIQAKKDNTKLSLKVRGKNQYRLFFDDKTGIAMTYLNKKNVGIMPFTLKHQINCACSVEDDNGFEVLYGGFTDGYVRRLDSGNNFDGLSVPSFIRTAYYHYGTPGTKKRFRELNLELNADASTTVNVFPDYDFGGTYVPKSSPVSDAYPITVTADDWNQDDVSNSNTGVTVVASERLKINGIGTNMGLIIKNDSTYDKPITLQGAIVYYTPRGVRR